jgi:hypothetical protein
MAEVSSVQQSRITATLDGVALGIFEDRGEFEVTAPDGTYRLGNMGPEKTLGGKASNGTVTVTRIMDTLALGQRKWIRGRVGKGWLVINEQPLTIDEVAEGEPDVWSGRLVGYSQAGRDADGDDGMTYTLTCKPETAG